MSRRVIGLIVGLGVVVLVGVLLIVGESVARGVVTDRVDQQLRQAFALEADDPIDVTVDGPVVLWQLVQGRLDRVTADIPGVEAGSIRADLTLVAEGVALDEAAPTDRVEATARIAQSDLTSALGTLGGVALNELELIDGEVRVSTGFEFFGISLTFELGIVPTIADGVIGLSPSSLALNGERVELDDVRDQLGDAVAPVIDPLLGPFEFCIAEALPSALDEQEVTVLDGELVVQVAGSDVVLGSDLATRGTCP